METDTNSADFASLAEAREAYSALTADLEAAQTLASEAQAGADSLRAELGTATATISALENRVGQLETALGEAQARVNTLEAEAQSAERIAAQMAASVGVEPVAVAPGQSADSKSLDELWAEYGTKPNAKAKREFYLSAIKPRL